MVHSMGIVVEDVFWGGTACRLVDVYLGILQNMGLSQVVQVFDSSCLTPQND